MAIIIENSQPVEQSTNFTFNQRYIARVCLVAALGGVLFGFDLVVISGAVPFFTQDFQLSSVQQGLAVGCINLGSALGALVAGRLSDSLGRRKFLLPCALLFALTGVGTGWAGGFAWFVFFRILSGVAVGAAALVAPMYIAEIAPANLRGRLIAFYQLAIVVGLLLAYIANYALLNVGPNNWRWMFTSQAAPALLFFVGLFFVPESPRWLVKKRLLDQARAVLKRVGGESYAAAEMTAIQGTVSTQSQESLSDLFKPNLRRALTVGCLVAIFSQIAGQNSVLSYAPVIFAQTGIGASSSFAQSILVGVICFAFTFVAIGSVDKVGRRTLLLWGSLLLALFLAGLAVSFQLNWTSGYIVLGLILAYVGTYSATLGPVTWVAVSEIFPTRIRGYAMAVATLTLWIANFFTTASFPILKEEFGLAVTFGIHMVICLVYFAVVWRYVPETKGKSLEEIEAIMTA
ncbi:sugar porter family MFS transporter [Hymenobacter terrenus]|uniref:sugar porter family MFS transporter n=1 Tax=Hymenobacter terrenus TaxID=1629124 RepID=UPI000619303E|nr:sugar porter family MFS transporter [Hymenobacter terrenus]